MIDVCLLVSLNFFSNRYSSDSFCPIFVKLGTRDQCASAEQTVEQIFEILILKFLANFSTFKFGRQQQSYLG